MATPVFMILVSVSRPTTKSCTTASHKLNNVIVVAAAAFGVIARKAGSSRASHFVGLFSLADIDATLQDLVAILFAKF